MQKAVVMLCTFLIFIISGASAFSAEVTPYLAEDSIPPYLLTAPLKPYSQEWNAEINDIISRQKKHNKDELAKAASERDVSPELVALAVIPNLTREDFPLTYHLLERVSKTTHIIGDNAKNYWKTKRPFVMDQRIKPLIDPHNNPSYPSGHTVGSYSWAHTLSLLIPEKKANFLGRAEEIAQHRVLVGMHYPHDLRGGRELAMLIMGGFSQNEEFLQDLQAAKNEIEKSKLLDANYKQK